MLFIQYGEYQHAVGEASLTIQKRPVYAPNGYRRATRETWSIQGVLQGDSIADLTTKINELLDAYGTNGQDVSLFTEAGGVTSHAMKSANTVGGVRVTALDFPDGEGAEYATGRTYSIKLEADFPDNEQNLMQFRETLAFTGTGGPRFVVIPLVTGAPIAQKTNERTPVQITQSGSALGYSSYPALPAPLFPAYEHVDRRQDRLKGPQNRRGTFVGFGREWSYKFTSPSSQSGTPTQL